MSDSEDKSPPPLPDRPEGVRGARDKPERQLRLSSGDVVGGRFRVDRYLGSSAGAVSYQCRDLEGGGRAVLKVVSETDEGSPDLEDLREAVRPASQVRHPNLTSIFGMGITEEGHVFVAMEYVEGRSLARAVAEARQRGHHVDALEVYDVLVQVSAALEAAHERTAHGVVTPYNVYLDSEGRIKLANLGLGAALGRRAKSGNRGPMADSIFVAPEVASGGEPTPAADVYSLGMLAAALLVDGHLPNDRKAARRSALELAAEQGEALFDPVHNAVSEQPEGRPADAGAFLAALNVGYESAGVELTASRPEKGLGVMPAVEPEEDEDLFDIPDLNVDSEPEQEEKRFLVRRDGLDYGPFSKEEVLEQLYEDEIDEDTKIQDRTLQKRVPLGELEAFVEEVEEYIPVREERRRKQAERRAELERKVKQGGRAVLVAGIVAGLVVLAGMLYFYLNRPEPKPMPMAKAFVSLDYEFMPPPKDFQTVSVDDDVLESIFNPEASRKKLAQKIRKARQRTRRSAGGAGGAANQGAGGGGSDQEVNTVDMSDNSGSKRLLSDNEIFDIILTNFDALRGCIHQELDRNPSFSGVNVQFFIRPSGTTGGVKIKESKYRNTPVGRCLVQKFRTMKFPEHSAVSNKGVTFPLTVKR